MNENIEDIETEALKRSLYGPIRTGSKEKMLNGDIFIAKINLDGQQHRLFFEVELRILRQNTFYFKTLLELFGER